MSSTVEKEDLFGYWFLMMCFEDPRVSEHIGILIRNDQGGGYFTVEVEVRKVKKYTVMEATKKCNCKAQEEMDIMRYM
ncbi:unnamed protein product [Arabis nemorensis]|uniref:Uncharacterized protein n=1 Tax=Arabis nemorensis TaxID=586526 RepID=A0A565CQR4_9BRAS|nr:unnamed protein product [Arabis nemorensis]